jgi:hypothetical protein
MIERTKKQENVRRIESGLFLPHSGIRFPQNPCTTCPFIGICLDKPELVEAGLIGKPGVDLGLFDDFLAKRFPESRRNAYYLMSIPPEARHELKEVGWTKGLELAKIARRDKAALRLCNLVAQGARTAEGELQAGGREGATGKDEEPSELIYFMVYKSQIPVIEQAIETAALMLGTDKSRGYCLEMICADFLAVLAPFRTHLCRRVSEVSCLRA